MGQHGAGPGDIAGRARTRGPAPYCPHAHMRAAPPHAPPHARLIFPASRKLEMAVRRLGAQNVASARMLLLALVRLQLLALVLVLALACLPAGPTHGPR